MLDAKSRTAIIERYVSAKIKADQLGNAKKKINKNELHRS